MPVVTVGQMAALCPSRGKTGRCKGIRKLQDILEEAAAALAQLAGTLFRRLCIAQAPVALVGGVSKLGEAITIPLARNLAELGLSLQAPLYTPAIGGVLYTCSLLTGRFPSPGNSGALPCIPKSKADKGVIKSHDDGYLF